MATGEYKALKEDKDDGSRGSSTGRSRVHQRSSSASSIRDVVGGVFKRSRKKKKKHREGGASDAELTTSGSSLDDEPSDADTSTDARPTPTAMASPRLAANLRPRSGSDVHHLRPDVHAEGLVIQSIRLVVAERCDQLDQGTHALQASVATLAADLKEARNQLTEVMFALDAVAHQRPFFIDSNGRWADPPPAADTRRSTGCCRRRDRDDDDSDDACCSCFDNILCCFI